jgi:hypothetical protein
MRQTVLNSGQFQRPGDIDPKPAVSFLDAPPTKTAVVAPRAAFWPIVAIGIGGLATLAWNGFLIWGAAHAVLGWLSGSA